MLRQFRIPYTKKTPFHLAKFWDGGGNIINIGCDIFEINLLYIL
jgi:hypothetical protein